MDEAKRRLLQRMPIFGAVSGEAMAFLLDRSTRIEVPRGDWFFREGDRGGSAIVLERGSATVLKRGEDRLHPLLELAPGDCFGEVSLLDFGRRSASVRADEDCAGLELTARDLHALATPHPDQFAIVYMNLGREVARRLRRADERLFRNKLALGEPAVRGYSFSPE